MLKLRKERCFNDYSLEEEEKKSKFIFGSMENISVITISVPNASRTIQKKVISVSIKDNYDESRFTIAAMSADSAIVFLYDDDWISLYTSNQEIIPEIYLVPFSDGDVSVCATSSGYIIRESKNSGFRINDAKALKSYLLGKSYSLYNLSSGRVNGRWMDLEKDKTLITAWSEYGNKAKIKAFFKINTLRTTGVLSFLIFSSWINIAYQVNAFESHLIGQNNFYTTQISKVASSMGLPPTAPSENIVSLVERPSQVKAPAFKTILSHHLNDSFVINSKKAQINSIKKKLPELADYEVVYDK